MPPFSLVALDEHVTSSLTVIRSASIASALLTTNLVSSHCGTAAASDAQPAYDVAADGDFFRIPRFARRDAFVAVTVRSPLPG